MYFNTKEKKGDFKEIFTLKEFERFIEKNCKLYFNFKSSIVKKRLNETYEKFCVMDEKITLRNFNKIFYENYGLSSTQQDDKQSLHERGFNDKEIEYFLKKKAEKRMLSINKKQQNEMTKNKNTYFFGKHFFVSDTKPICKCCGSELNFRKKLNKPNTYEILSCSNPKCLAHTHYQKYKAFLPDNLAKSIIENIAKTKCYNKNYWIKKGLSEEESIAKISEMQKSYSSKVKTRFKFTKEECQKKYGIENSEHFFKKRSHFCIEYWTKKGLSEEESIAKISEIQIKNSEKLKKAMNENPQKYRAKNKRCTEYWLNKGVSEEDAKNNISELQKTFSLDKCIKRYGEIEGTKKWKERQVKWQMSLHRNGNLHVGFSKVSQELFDEISKSYVTTDFLFYGTKNREYSINHDGTNFIYDFCDLEQRKIIEFQGDIYHANPLFYKEDDTPNPFTNKTAKEIWDHDRLKSEIAIKNNFKVFTVWENDYRKDKNKVLKECIKYLKNEVI